MSSGEPPGWSGAQPPAQQPPPGYGHPQQPPPQYPQQYQQGYQPGPGPQKTNGMAVASLVLGLLWVCSVGSILAVIFGYMALKQIDRSEGREGGRGLAITGIVLGWIGVALLVLYLILLAAGVATFEFKTST